MKSSPSRLPRSIAVASKGFTLVEVLIVIVIIAVLAAITLSVTRSARLAADKVADMANLRSLSTAATAAGNDSGGRFPQIHDPNSQYPYYLVGREKLEAAGIFKEACYAPTRNVMGGAPTYEWWFRSPTNTPVHYSYLANDADLPTGAWFLRGGTVNPPPRSEYRGAIPYETIIQNPAKAFARSVNDDAWYSVLWAGICREYSGEKVAALMRNGEVVGVNVIYVDGHAEFVPKVKMRPRYVGGGVTVYF